MRKTRILGLAFLFLAGVVGCSADPREDKISGIISTIDNTTSSLSSVREKLQKTIEDRKKEGKLLTDEDFKKVQVLAEELKRNGAVLLRLKEDSDRLGDTTSEAQKKEFAERNRTIILPKLLALDKAVRELEQVVAESEKMPADEPAREQLKAFKDTLKAGTDNFLLMSKQR